MGLFMDKKAEVTDVTNVFWCILPCDNNCSKILRAHTIAIFPYACKTQTTLWKVLIEENFTV